MSVGAMGIYIRRVKLQVLLHFVALYNEKNTPAGAASGVNADAGGELLSWNGWSPNQ